MGTARPQSYLALALATLAVTLATWWAWDTFSGSDPTEDKAAGAGTFLPPDEYPPVDPPQAKPEPVTLKTAPASELDEGRPPLTPPKVEPPTLVAPTTVEDDPEDDEPVVLPEPDEEKKRSARDMLSRSAISRLIGGVARTSERATREVYVKEGSGWIGSPGDWVRNLGAQRRNVNYVALPMEAPRHLVEFDPFHIDRFETSNQNYWYFLQTTSSVLYRTSDHDARSIVEITDFLIVDPPRNLDLAEVTGRQLFKANATAFLQVFRGAAVVSEDGETIDLDATYDAVKDRPVPPGVDIRFYRRAPPGTWPDDRFLERETDHPVRDVSIEDATAFALWRGRFVPTEQQWEYVTRGPNGANWPWGNDGQRYDELVHGGQPIPPDREPETRSVFQGGAGASWVGVFQLLGNVSEWTSSFLDAYPDGQRTLPGVAERQVVVRGGSIADRDPYLVRPAFRGWLAEDPGGAPRIEQRRWWTGFRTARYGPRSRLDAIHSRIPILHFRARKYRRFVRELLQDDVFAGVEGLHTERFQHIVGEDPDIARRKTRPGVKTIVVNPLSVIGISDRGRWRPNTDASIDGADNLIEQPAPVLYALLHTDIGLLDAWQSAEEPFNTFQLPTRLRRADVPPGTYYLASIQGVMSLITPDGTRVWYLQNRPASEAALNVLPRKYRGTVREPRVNQFRLRSIDRLDIDFEVPTTADATPGYAARIVLRLNPDDLQVRTLTEVRQATGPR